MHGRLKVRTTEEQAEAKRKEQQEKLKIYLKTTSKIFSKREKDEHDEEGLQLTGLILEHNPDFYTLWNYRREILLDMKPSKTAEEIKTLSTTEMSLTQHCLQKNPKSYSAWHHRFWAMEFNPDADWKRELKLCSYFQSQDERNFHSWDYRRRVAKKCNISPLEELNYSTELIDTNFSNYSAWHYRSTLLPIVHPGPTKESLSEAVLLKELNTVQNAAFTDPDDQSVWFYHRWLLGRSKVPLQILNIAVIKSQQIVAVLLSEPEEVDNQSLRLAINGISVNTSWKSVSSHTPVSTIWICSVHDEMAESSGYQAAVELKKGNAQGFLSCSADGEASFAWSKTSRADAFRSELSAATKEVLESELESCQQLLEMEPDSKWTLFTCILLMRALNDVKFQQTIREYMKQLKESDSARKNYYNDLESKIVIEDYIEDLPLVAKEVNLSNKNLTSLHHFDQFLLIETIDLSSNNLSSVFPLCNLISVKKIVLDDNHLTNFCGLEQLQSLKILSAKKNYIDNAKSLEILKNCENLEELYIEDNPVLKDQNLEFLSVLKQFPAIKIIEPST